MFTRNSSKYKNIDTQSRSSFVPKGILLHLSIDQIKTSVNNPRRLFDRGPLDSLKESIRLHGVLVPITVYKLPGQEKYGIVDGERRYRCCVELNNEGINIQLPANVVETPDKIASIIYMFNIHAFREQWELMPIALSLKQIMNELKIEDNKELNELIGLSIAQIERCKKILSYPEKYQLLSLDENPEKRIPSNFWVELYPVLEISRDAVPDIYKDLGRDGITDRMVEKYRAKSIKSVIHFRRIMEAFEVSESDTWQEVADRLRDFILTTALETRSAFDIFILDPHRIQKAVIACDMYIRDIERAKVTYSIDGKDELIKRGGNLVIRINKNAKVNQDYY
jgi:ParB family chromosome partitioning protein